MATVQELIDKLESFDIHKEAVNVISAHKEDFVKLNREQMMKGKRRDDRLIQDPPGNPYKLKWYKKLKERMNPLAGGKVDLSFTTSFQKGMIVNIDGDNINEFSTDNKSDMLQNKYGNDIFGLTDDSQTVFNWELLYPDYMNSIEQKTGLRAGS